MTRGAPTPAVSRATRTALAGVVWSAVGVMLIARATASLLSAQAVAAVALGFGGLASGLAGWRLLFTRLVARNRARIALGPERACVFGFQPAKSYLVMGCMITLGIALRHSTIPAVGLAVVYVAVGIALLFSSTGYYRDLFVLRKGELR